MSESSVMMAEAGAESLERGGRGQANGLVRVADTLTQAAGALAAVVLVVMTGIVCFEIFSRYVLNEPTWWGSEIVTYLLVGMTFAGLAAAQRSGEHVRVELLLDALPAERRAALEIFSNWLGLIFVLFAGWQMALFNAAEYVNDTRDWGLLATPQWIPELPVTIGYAIFALSIFADLVAASRAEAGRALLALAILLALLPVLALLGARPPMLIGRIDGGSALLLPAVLVSAVLISGPRMALAVASVGLVFGLIFAAAKGAGLLLIGALLVVTLLVLLLIGVRVALTLGLVGLLGLLFLLPSPQLSLLAERSWNAVNTFTLSAVPMFVLMGALLIRSGVTREMFDALTKWFGRTPGGVAHATVGASAVFAAVSGSSLATAATMGKVAAPEMIARGYSRRLTYGVIGAGATLGILIPPSIAMIIYGTTAGVPVTQLFIAGIIPGLLLSACFMAGVFVWSVLRPEATPPGDAYPLSEKIGGSLAVLPFALIILVVLGSLYFGVATPSEAGGVGVAASLAVCLLRGMLTPRAMAEIALETVRITSFLLLIVVGAAIMSWVFDFLRIPRTLVQVVEDAGLAPWLVMLVIGALYLVLGMFVESISMILMTLPVTFPIVTALGLDPVWFGVFLVVMIEIGLVTPPVGIVLFILRGVARDVPLSEIVYGVLPFVGILIGFQVLIYLVPEIVTFLPARVG
ncbi:MAG: TRAP transporter large permease subunit [Alphaproteobacteria bacterium]